MDKEETQNSENSRFGWFPASEVTGSRMGLSGREDHARGSEAAPRSRNCSQPRTPSSPQCKLSLLAAIAFLREKGGSAVLAGFKSSASLDTHTAASSPARAPRRRDLTGYGTSPRTPRVSTAPRGGGTTAPGKPRAGRAPPPPALRPEDGTGGREGGRGAGGGREDGRAGGILRGA
jgi:hypothetical protein